VQGIVPAVMLYWAPMAYCLSIDLRARVFDLSTAACCLSLVLLALGGGAYVAAVPERWAAPGRFDIVARAPLPVAQAAPRSFRLLLTQAQRQPGAVAPAHARVCRAGVHAHDGLCVRAACSGESSRRSVGRL